MPSVEGSNRPWRRVGNNKEIIIFSDGAVIGRKVSTTNSGYHTFGLDNKTAYVHRVVYEAFVGPIPKGYDINHENGIKTDNRVENLTAVSRSENQLHAYRNGLNKGISYPGNKNANYRNGAYLNMTRYQYHKAWNRAKYRGLDWKNMTVKERLAILETPKRNNQGK